MQKTETNNGLQISITLTGEPGCGKSYVTHELIQFFESAGFSDIATYDDITDDIDNNHQIVIVNSCETKPSADAVSLARFVNDYGAYTQLADAELEEGNIDKAVEDAKMAAYLKVQAFALTQRILDAALMVKNDKTALDITMLNTMVETYHTLREIFDYKIAVSEDQWYQIMNVPVEALRDAVSSILLSYDVDIDYGNNDEANAYYNTVDAILWGHFKPQTVAEIVDYYRSRLG